MKKVLLIILFGCISLTSNAQWGRVTPNLAYADSLYNMPVGVLMHRAQQKKIDDSEYALINALYSLIGGASGLQAVCTVGNTTTTDIIVTDGLGNDLSFLSGSNVGAQDATGDYKAGVTAIGSGNTYWYLQTPTGFQAVSPGLMTASHTFYLPADVGAFTDYRNSFVMHYGANDITITDGTAFAFVNKTIIDVGDGINYTTGAEVNKVFARNHFGTVDSKSWLSDSMITYHYKNSVGAVDWTYNLHYHSGVPVSTGTYDWWMPNANGHIAPLEDTISGSGDNPVLATQTYVASHSVASIPGRFTVNAQVGTSYTVALVDTCANCLLTGTNGSAQNYTIPPNGTTAFPTFSQIKIMNTGAGTITFLAGAGVTIHTPNSDLDLNLLPGNSCFLFKTATNTWWISGGNTP